MLFLILSLVFFVRSIFLVPFILQAKINLSCRHITQKDKPADLFGNTVSYFFNVFKLLKRKLSVLSVVKFCVKIDGNRSCVHRLCAKKQK